jgi:hypothetical protein
MQFTGNGEETLYNLRRPFVIPNSVVGKYDDDGNLQIVGENTQPIYLAEGLYQDWFNKYGANEGGEIYLLDRSFVKLRNITLAYSLPKRLVRQAYLSEVTLSLFCNNVFTWTHKTNRHIDPETSSYNNDLSGMFGELYSNPACRNFGFNVGIKF